jgi:hypothetical protein
MHPHTPGLALFSSLTTISDTLFSRFRIPADDVTVNWSSIQVVRELGRQIEQDHDPTCVDAAQKLQAAEKDAADASTKRSHDEGVVSFNVNQVLMLHIRLKIIQTRAAQPNKAALESEKERDELHTQIEEIEEQL